MEDKAKEREEKRKGRRKGKKKEKRKGVVRLANNGGSLLNTAHNSVTSSIKCVRKIIKIITIKAKKKKKCSINLPNKVVEVFQNSILDTEHWPFGSTYLWFCFITISILIFINHKKKNKKQ